MLERARVAVALAGITVSAAGGYGMWESTEGIDKSGEAYRQAYQVNDTEGMRKADHEMAGNVFMMLLSIGVAVGGIGTAVFIIDDLDKQSKERENSA